MIVGITGTRYGPTPAQHDAMRSFLGGLPMTRFVHGAANGVDTLAHYIVRLIHRDIPIELHPASTNYTTIITIPMKSNTEIFPERPPLERNRVMVSRIDGLVAVPREDTEIVRSGTWATVRYAREIGCPVYVIQQNGSIVRDTGGPHGFVRGSDQFDRTRCGRT